MEVLFPLVGQRTGPKILCANSTQSEHMHSNIKTAQHHVAVVSREPILPFSSRRANTNARRTSARTPASFLRPGKPPVECCRRCRWCRLRDDCAAALRAPRPKITAVLRTPRGNNKAEWRARTQGEWLCSRKCEKRLRRLQAPRRVALAAYFALAWVLSTFFTIFCSSTRKARMMRSRTAPAERTPP